MSKIPVFDIGDTLVPSRKFVEHIIEDELRQRNHKPVHKFDPNKFKMYNAEGIHTYLEKYDLDGDAEKLAEKCRDRYLEAFEDLLIENDVFDIFAKCNIELGTIGIISDNSIRAKNLIEELLEKHSVEYATVTVSDEIGVEKPDPRIFEAFTDSQNRPAEDFVYFGNDASCDAGALDAGIDFVWVTQFNTVNSSFEGPSIEELTFENIKNVIEELEQ